MLIDARTCILLSKGLFGMSADYSFLFLWVDKSDEIFFWLQDLSCPYQAATIVLPTTRKVQIILYLISVKEVGEMWFNFEKFENILWLFSSIKSIFELKESCFKPRDVFRGFFLPLKKFIAKMATSHHGGFIWSCVACGRYIRRGLETGVVPKRILPGLLRWLVLARRGIHSPSVFGL